MPPLFLLLLVAVAEAARNVTVSKCCPFSHTLTNENKCVPVTAPEWNLRVYSPTSRKYLPLNQVPPNWHLQEAVKPPCSIPGLLTTSTLGSYVPFQNGSLFVVHNSKLVHPPDYCIDYNAVLYCLQEEQEAENITFVQVKKCCGENAIFSDTNKTCIHMKNGGYKVDVGSEKRLVEGFPNCHQQELVFVGKLKEADMLRNGSLVLQESKVVVPPGNYCLEHVLEDAGECLLKPVAKMMWGFCRFRRFDFMRESNHKNIVFLYHHRWRGL